MGVPAALGMGVMEVQIRDSRPEPILILPPPSPRVDSPVVRFVSVRTYLPKRFAAPSPDRRFDGPLALLWRGGCTTIAAR